MAKVSRGAAGETLAARFLRRRGYELVEANYHSRFGEIDIIAENERFLVFAEVKTRGEQALYEPREAVFGEKQRKILKTALLYLAQNPSEKQPRFDVIEVFMDPHSPMKAKKIEHIENAFEADGVGAAF